MLRPETSNNKTLKFAFVVSSKAFEEAKAHSLTKPSLARLRSVLNARR
jgi:hypothetical protein